MKNLSFILLALVLFASCKAKQIVLTDKVTETITETVHDTIFVIAPDTSHYQAQVLIENGKPVLNNPTSKPGKNLNAPKVNLDDNGLLTVECEARAQELFAQWKSTHKATVIETEVPVYIETPLTQWQVLYIKLGKIFGVLLVVALGYSLFKIYKNVKN